MVSDKTRSKALADFIVLHRAKAGLSVTRAAELAGMNRATWADLEDAAARLPRPETLKPVAEVLGVDVEQLLVAGGFIDPLTPAEVSGLAETLRAIVATIDVIEARVRALELPDGQTHPADVEAPASPSNGHQNKKNSRRRS